MSLIQISMELRQEVHSAMASPFRFERHERFAMRQLLQSGQVRDLADEVYVEAARKALQTRRVKSTPAAPAGLRRNGGRRV